MYTPRMCRLLGIVASERTSFHFALHLAPRSLASLSNEHPHGWGIAVYDAPAGWTIEKQPMRASECLSFYKVSSTLQGELLLAHVRARTVGPSTLANTHPFRRGRWVFAHNGTITDTRFLRENISGERLAEIQGDTDSELLFSYLLTQLDGAGLAAAPASPRTDEVLVAAVRRARHEPGFGACNFLLSDGQVLYAHRFGRTLFTLERKPTDALHMHRESHETGVAIDTPWSAARQAVLIASEEMSEEPWQPVAEGTLLRCERGAHPSLQVLDPGAA